MIKNSGRLDYAKANNGMDCPAFIDFDFTLVKAKADLINITTMRNSGN